MCMCVAQLISKVLSEYKVRFWSVMCGRLPCFFCAER